ncbi:DUF2490 domain-containing protein [Leeuwenhoekiella sp. NPDC079379]|uniref:DUF2490 domain-containing protein n=1 Tax=Leeuwenhoekiella sp. NPDC079379 TaxID=3364122 RepID=UPI0037C8CA08
MINSKICFFTYSFLLAFSTFLNAQKTIDHQQLLWTGYSLKLKINESYQLRQEIEERTYWFPWRQHQFIARTMAERKLSKGWSAAAGLAYLEQTSPQDPTIKSYTTTAELRPLAELAYAQELGAKLSLNHRYWGEFRFFEQPDGSFDFGNIRARYKLELRYAPTAQLTFKAFDEIHLNIGNNIVQNVFDQNRYGTSAQYMFIENLGIELGYFNWFQQRASGTDFYNRNIIRLTIHHKLKLKS